jgi:2-oxoglutarate dehydrogenase E2 component (dihydrolipoamide succinyltransferase)
MALTEIRLPALGEGITEATITRWLVKQGDEVTSDTPLVEIATDKVDTEVISPVEGTIAELLFPEQSVPKIGQVLLKIFTEAEDHTSVSEPVSPAEKTSVLIPQVTNTITAIKPSIPKAEHKFVAPFVRYLATSEGITPDELYGIEGSGPDGNITKEDILRYMQQRPLETPSVHINGYKAPEIHYEPSEPPIAGSNETVIPMDRVRKLIAKNMVDSKKTAPHVTVFSEVDVTPIVEWRNNIKQQFQKKYNENLTFTPVFIEAVAKALMDFPGINISVKDEYIIKKHSINIGMAVALPDGNLIVPVVKNAGQLNLPELARQVNDLSRRARIGKLKPAEIQEGTFTITNIGSFGNISGTPIINQPQAAILAIGTIIKKPAAVNINGVLGIGLRDILTLSLAFDHRAVDGAMGGSFLQRICQNLNNFNPGREM